MRKSARANNPTRTVAVVVGIETYLHSKTTQGVRGVPFAEADARAIAETLKKQFKIEDSDLHLWINEEATKTRFENDLKYLAASLGPQDRFILYYAGHGFYANGANRLTVWDTHPTSVGTTTVCMKDVLLSPLEGSQCSQILMFIDACAIPLPDALSSRELLSEMDKKEFEAFVRTNQYQAIFMSCSPGEKSFPSQSLSHGIWTFHLLRALNGKELDALMRGEWLTDVSLRDYLRHAVEQFIREKTKIKATQRPFALVNGSHTFEILRFEEDEAPAEMPRLKLNAEEMFFRNRGSMGYRDLPGFDKKRGHTVPDRHSPSADNWASRLLADDIEAESKTVYENAKKVLGLKRAQVKRSVGDGGATVDTEFFRMSWDTGQDPADAGMAIVTRQLQLRVRPAALPEDFDSIFPVDPDEMVIPIEGKIGFDKVANGFEALADTLEGAAFEEDEDEGRASLSLGDGTAITVLTDANELIVTVANTSGALALLQESAGTLTKIGQKDVALLLARREAKEIDVPRS